MYFKSREELKALRPFENGSWNKDALEEYLIQSCHSGLSKEIDGFMAEYQGDEALAELLFSFLLDDSYDGSDCQIGAAYYIARMERSVLRKKRDLLLRAQQNEITWKRPFRDSESLDWLTLTE